MDKHTFITWRQIERDMVPLKHFKPQEFQHPHRINIAALNLLDHMREREGNYQSIYITINTDYRPGDPLSHGKGLAFDIVIWDGKTGKPLPVLEQFFIASRYAWRGIGMYPYWKTPGIHVDLRPSGEYRKSLWWRDSMGKYRTMKDYADAFLFRGRKK